MLFGGLPQLYLLHLRFSLIQNHLHAMGALAKLKQLASAPNQAFTCLMLDRNTEDRLLPFCHMSATAASQLACLAPVCTQP